jgi:hypothetical protein
MSGDYCVMIDVNSDNELYIQWIYNDKMIVVQWITITRRWLCG